MQNNGEATTFLQNYKHVQSLFIILLLQSNKVVACKDSELHHLSLTSLALVASHFDGKIENSSGPLNCIEKAFRELRKLGKFD